MELAEKLSVPLAVVERYESGEEDPSHQLDGIALVTGKSSAWLRGENDDPASAAAGLTTEPEPEPETAAASEPEPDLEHSEEEPMHEESEPAGMFGGHEPATPDEPEPAPAGGPDQDDFSEDELTRVLSGLSRQRDALAARRKELDDREQALSEREDHIGAREDAVTDREQALNAQEGSRSALLDEEWQERLRSFEETNRQYAAATSALADWAAELQGGSRSDDGPEEAEEHHEPSARYGDAASHGAPAVDEDPDEPESPPAVPDPDEFSEDF